MYDTVIYKGELEYKKQKYPIYAHSEDSKKERYNQHAEKTALIFEYLLKDQEEIISRLFKDLNINLSLSDFKSILRDLVNFHDLGKLNPKFQIKKLGNQSFPPIKIPDETTTNHSHLSAFLLATSLLEKYDFMENSSILIIPYIILGHHTGVKNPHEANLVGDDFDSSISTLIKFPEVFKLENEKLEEIINTLGSNEYSGIYKDFLNILSDLESSSLSILYNLIYSNLIISDFIATAYAFEDVESLKEDLSEFNRRINENMLAVMMEKFEKRQVEYANSIDKSGLNKYKKEMFDEAKKNLNNALVKNKRVFFLKVPTGGGKTNTSLGLALEILKSKRANRLIYALPYINILEQNYEFLQEVFNLSEPEDTRKIYSGTETIFDVTDEEKEKILTDDDFYNYPVICTTNVSLFNSIIKFNKKHKYRFSALANSIIILDEIQSLSPEYWPEFNYLINEIADKLNIHIIIMSATVPSLEKLKHTRSQNPKFEKEVCYLLDDPDRYYRNFNRNEIKTKSLMEFDIGENSGKEKLKDILRNICNENFEMGNNHGMIVLNTIKTSQIVYDLLSNVSEKDKWNASILLLNSTFLPVQKRAIIDKVKNLNDNEKIILVSTQSVEAGMDVSFNFVVRDFAILDSIEQVRGRCNRYKERETGSVYLIEIKKNNRADHSIYEKWMVEGTKEILGGELNYDFKTIERYYDHAIKQINRILSKKDKLTAADNIKYWNTLNFESMDSKRNKEKPVFHVDVIKENQNSFPFFVETDIPRDKFTSRLVGYIIKKQEETDIKLISDEKVIGKGIIEYYSKEVEKLRGRDFTAKKIFKREIISVLSNFVFHATIHTSNKRFKDIKIDLDNLFMKNKTDPFYIIKNDKVGDNPESWYSLTRGLSNKFFDSLSKDTNFV